MKTFNLLRVVATLMATTLAFHAGHASAATGTQAYSILIKDGRGGAVISAPPSGLSFTGSQTKANGDYPPEPSPAPVVTVTSGSGIRPANLPMVFKNVDSSFKVRVAGSTLNGQDQGQNVAGLVGRLTTDVKNVSGKNVRFAIDFTVSGPSATGQFMRGYSIRQINADGTETAPVNSGAYHIANPASLPEPGSLVLIAAGFLSLAFAVSRRKTFEVNC